MSKPQLLPLLRFPEFGANYKTFQLKEVLELLTDFEANGSFADVKANVNVSDSSDYAWYVRATDLENKTSLEDVKYVDERSYIFLRKTKLFGEELLITKRGEIGKLYYFNPENSIKATLAPNLYLLKLKKDRIDPYYLYNLFQGHKGNKKLKRINASTTIGALYKNDVKNIKIELPSLLEQQKIASFLSEVDKKIQLLEHKKSLLEQYKKGVMQKLFSREIRFKPDGGGEFPEWEEVKAKYLFRNHSNKNHNGELPILSASQEHGMILREDSGIQIRSSKKSIKSYKIVEPNDFVISLRSFQGGIDFSEIKGICSPAYIVLKNNLPIDYQLFKFYFKKDDFVERLSKTTVGIRDGKQITYDNFGGLKLPYPSIQEQIKMSNFLNSIEKKIALTFQQIEKSIQFKKGLLQLMFV